MATSKQLKDTLPKHAKSAVEEQKTKFIEENYKGNEKPEYTRLQFKRIYKGYDFLENLILIRKVIERKYGIEFRLLEQILYLTPKNLFKLQDFWEIATLTYSYKRIDTLIKLGLIAVVSKGINKQEHIYAPTTKARTICQEFHEMLSGQMEVPTDQLERSEHKTDNIRAKLIKELAKKEKPKTVQLLWAKKVK